MRGIVASAATTGDNALVKLSLLAVLACALLLEAAPPRRRISYAGLTLATNHTELLARYPHSSYDTSENGTLTIRVADRDMRDGIADIQLRRDRDNRTTRLTLRFQPHTGPRCADIIRSLTRLYGSPKKERVWYEEAMRHEPLLWWDDTAQLRFDCGEYAIVLEPRKP